MNSTFPLPPVPLRFMGEDDEKFLSMANQNAKLLYSNGLNPSSDALLDLGCGYGRLAYGLDNGLNFKGHYLGIDILKRHITWCQNNIYASNSGYEFKHFDIQNGRYNPDGKILADNWKFDLPNEHYNYVCLFSVFTHMYEDEIRNYLNEIYRVLQFGGRCLATFFLYDTERLKEITDIRRGRRMPYVLNDHTRYHSKEDKLQAIAYDRFFIESMVVECGFQLSTVNYGRWGGGSETFQDYIVFDKLK